MDDTELRSVIDAYLRDAVGFLDEELGHEREQALRYYHGETPDLPKRDGFSTVVSRDVYDTVEWIMPSLLKVFHGSEKAVSFEPTGQEDEAFADQATDYVNHIYNKDNPGFLISYDVLKDSLIQKLGVVKHWWDVSEETVEETYEDLTADELAALEADDDIEIIEDESDAKGNQERAPQALRGLQDGQEEGEEGPEVVLTPFGPIELFNVRVRKTVKRGKVSVEGVPPEDFLIEPRTRSPERCRFVAHRNEMTRSDLLEEGYDPEVIDNLAGDHEADFDEERDARFPEQGERFLNIDRANEIITVYECYAKVDYDDDGRAELRKVVIAGGSQGEVLENEEIAGAIEDYFTWWSPIRTPHSVFGQSVADAVVDLQKLKTALWRQGLDSLYLSVAPETLVDTSAAVDETYDDLNDRQVGGMIRYNSQGGSAAPPQPFVTPSAHQQALEMINYVDQVAEKRTGVSSQSMGTNPDLLQNQTATAVNQVMTAAQQKVELIARLAAENLFKRLFRAILKLVVKYQDEERMIRLRNEFVPMDPRSWNADMDVSVNVGLGTGNKDQKIAYLMQLLGVQREALMAGLPIVTPKNIFNTLEELTTEVGLSSVDPYFIDPESDQGMQLAQMMQGQQGGGEMDAYMMAEQVKAQKDLQIEAMKDQREKAKMMGEFRLKVMNAMLEHDYDRDKLDYEIWKTAAEIQAEYGLELDKASIQAEIDQQRNLMGRQVA